METVLPVFTQNLSKSDKINLVDDGKTISSFNFNSCIDESEFPFGLKHPDIVPIHKKKYKSGKCNYRPVSILSNYSEVYEKLIYNQLYPYFENILFPGRCGFIKGYSTQHCLLVLIEKFKEAIDTGNKFGALLTDLSKAFDSQRRI